MQQRRPGRGRVELVSGGWTGGGFFFVFSGCFFLSFCNRTFHKALQAAASRAEFCPSSTMRLFKMGVLVGCCQALAGSHVGPASHKMAISLIPTSLLTVAKRRSSVVMQQGNGGYGGPQQNNGGYGGPQQNNGGYGGPQQNNGGYGGGPQQNNNGGYNNGPQGGYNNGQQNNGGYGGGPQQNINGGYNNGPQGGYTPPALDRSPGFTYGNNYGNSGGYSRGWRGRNSGYIPPAFDRSRGFTFGPDSPRPRPNVNPGSKTILPQLAPQPAYVRKNGYIPPSQDRKSGFNYNQNLNMNPNTPMMGGISPYKMARSSDTTHVSVAEPIGGTYTPDVRYTQQRPQQEMPMQQGGYNGGQQGSYNSGQQGYYNGGQQGSYNGGQMPVQQQRPM